jgi:hypothetical protein
VCTVSWLPLYVGYGQARGGLPCEVVAGGRLWMHGAAPLPASGPAYIILRVACAVPKLIRVTLYLGGFPQTGCALRALPRTS